MRLFVVDYRELSGSYALHAVLGFNDIFAVGDSSQCRRQKLRHVAVLERNLNFVTAVGPRISRYEVHLVEVQGVAELLFGVVALTDVNYVVVDILFHHVPRPSA